MMRVRLDARPPLINELVICAMRHSHPRAKNLFDELSAASNRRDRLEIMRREREFARAEFPTLLLRLERLLLQYNPFVVLATFALADLTYLPEVGRAMNEQDDIEQYHIEIVQALILCHEECEFQKRPLDPVEFQELRDLICYVAYLHGAKDLPNPIDTVSAVELDRLSFQSMLRAHTKAVRNWGYEEQTLSVLKRLYEPLDERTEKELGFRVSLLIDVVRAQLASIRHRLQEHFAKVQAFVQQKTTEGAVEVYLTEFEDPAITIAQVNCWVQNQGWTVENVRVMLFHRSNSFLPAVFAFEETDFIGNYPEIPNQVDCALSRWAVELGELKGSNREHLFLANPIWSRPIIRATSNILFWPIPTLFHSFCFEMIETVVCQREELKDKFLKRRGEFLEQYTAELFQKKFSAANVFLGSKWQDRATAKTGENDLLILFDSIALIIEEKSGAINAVAKRGGGSIKQEIEQLITEASQQAQTFAAFLQSNQTPHVFETESGRVNRVNTSFIKRFFCLIITLERFGPLATQLRGLQAVGLARRDVVLVPTMSLADLEISLELFRTPFEFLHYLTRRVALECQRKFLGDELDLLALYLETGFAEKSLPDSTRPLVIVGLGKKLDQFFINWPGDNRFERPQRSLSSWWKAILGKLEAKHVHRRYELGCALLDMPDEEQQAYEIEFRNLCEKVRITIGKPLGDVEAMWSHAKSDAANTVIVAVPVTSAICHERKYLVESLADRALGETGADQALVILVNVENRHWPYSGIYLLDRVPGDAPE